MKIVVTIPAYNEEKSIGEVIKDINRVMKSKRYDYKVLVLDDGSKDQTAKIAKKAGAIVFSHPHNQGLAATFRDEIKKALDLKADIIVHTDADGQYQARDIPRLIQEIKNNDLVLGSRFLGVIESMPLMKRIGNKAFSKVISGIIKYKIYDCQTGFRAFTKEIAKNINIISDYSYTQEQVIRVVKRGYRIKEIPVYFAKRKYGKSKLISNPFNYAVKSWINLLRIYRDYTPIKFFGFFGLTFLSIGFLIGIWLLYLFIKTGKVTHTSSAVLGALLIIVGIQIILFGFFADMHRK